MIFVGIDGGGTKTDFKVVDENNVEVFALTLGGCKPGYYGIEHSVEVLKEGLDSIAKNLDSIDAVYAGIAGCASPNELHKPIRTLLAKYSKNYRLDGDLLTSFRSASSGQYGIAFLSGSGSGIAHWYPGGFINLDSVCYGSREIVFLLSNAYAQGQFNEETEKLLVRVIDKEVLGRNAHYFLTHATRPQALKELRQDVVPETVWTELHKVFDIVVERWAFKGIGRILWHQSHTNERPTEIVLVGGMWSFDYIRELVIARIEEALGESVSIVFSPQKKPVDGAVKLAQELV